jgi:hypothetical protein
MSASASGESSVADNPFHKRVYKKKGMTDLMRKAQKHVGMIAEHFGGPGAREALNIGHRLGKRTTRKDAKKALRK